MSESGVRFSSIKEALNRIRVGAEVNCDYCGKPLDPDEKEIIFSNIEPLKIYHSGCHAQKKGEEKGSQ